MTAKNGYPQPVLDDCEKLRFNTEKGHCYVLADQIVITNSRNTTLEQVANISQHSYARIAIFLVPAIATLSLAVIGFLGGHIKIAALCLIAAFACGYFSRRLIHNMSVTVIYKQQVRYACFYGSGLDSRNPFFTIVHLERSVTTSTRVTMPRTEWSGNSNTAKALGLMHGVLGLTAKKATRGRP